MNEPLFQLTGMTMVQNLLTGYPSLLVVCGGVLLIGVALNYFAYKSDMKTTTN